MSHWVKCKSRIIDINILKDALAELNISIIDNTKLQIGSQKETVDFVLDGGCVGFQRQKDGTYNMVGDPYYSRNKYIKNFYKRENELLKIISEKYMVLKVKSDLEMNGFDISSESFNQSKNELQIIAAKFV